MKRNICDNHLKAMSQYEVHVESIKSNREFYSDDDLSSVKTSALDLVES